jgi:unsaturated rhamnogalacturonyl hydrolase
MNIIYLLGAIFLLSLSSPGIEVPGGFDPGILGKNVSENLLSREKLAMNPKGCLFYAEACTAVGALRFAEKINDAPLMNRIISRYEDFIREDGAFSCRIPHVDVHVMGIVPLQICMENKDERFLKAGLYLADNQWKNPREDGLTTQTRWWIDDMYMVGMLQIQAFRATGDKKYADRAARQIEAYLKKLQQPNGLFFHGPNFKYHWGRGNGWVAASLAEVLRSLPMDHELYPFIMDRYKKMMAALLKYQSDNGMWRQLVDYEYAWQESSCTAMFAYSMSVGVKQGWLEKEEYLPAVKKAWKALCAHLDRKGNIREVCVGTGQVDDIEFYLNRPRILGDLHGQAPFLWLAAEILDMDEVIP